VAPAPARDTVGVMRSPRRRRAYTLMEGLAVFALIGVISGAAVFSMRGGQTNGSDRRTQASVDAALDAAGIARETEGVFPGRAMSLAEVLAGRVQLIDAPAPATSAGAVSVHLDPTSDLVAAAALGPDGACWMARWRPSASGATPLRAYGIAPAGATTPCRGDTAAAVLDPSEGRGERWRLPQVLP
jgi:type II secretory pathway pseudopilin PulG